MDRVRRALNDDDDLLKVGYAAVVGIVAGALGPWYSTPGADILGTDGGGPGLYVLVFAAMAAAALYSWNETPGREKLIGVAICGGGALALMAYDAFAAHEIVDIAWGLILGIVSAVVVLAVAGRLAAINPT